MFGIAGNANPNLSVGDTTVAKYWAHTGLWNWQVQHSLIYFLDMQTLATLSVCSLLFACEDQLQDFDPPTNGIILMQVLFE